jgi:hypothetical protein
MAQTILDFYTDTAVLVGSYGPGEVLSPEDLAMIAATAEDLLEEWNVDGLLMPRIRNPIYPLVAGTADYTLGGLAVTATNLDTVRPLKIERQGRIVIGGVLTLPIDVVPFEQWATSIEKGNVKVKPDMVYCDYAFPIAALKVNPSPSGALGATYLELFVWQAFTAFGTDYTVDVSFPPAYSKAFKYSLAVNIAPRLANSAANLQLVIDTALGSKAIIQKLNAEIRGLMIQQPQPQPAQQ